jgi:hypothetical protein
MPTSRREFLRFACGAAAAVLAPRSIAATEWISNGPGRYRFIPGNAVFCTGVLPDVGFEVVHVLFDHPRPLAQAYAAIEAYLAAQKLSPAAVCGMELRVPRQMSVDGFRAFNQPYIDQLRRWNLHFDGASSVARSNVAPASDAPAQASVHAFSYVATATSRKPSFCVSGAADIEPNGAIVAAGEPQAIAMARKLEFLVAELGRRIRLLGFDWLDTSQVDLHFAGDFAELMPQLALRLGPVLAHGVRLYHARPPIEGSEMELEARAVARELVLAE